MNIAFSFSSPHRHIIYMMGEYQRKVIKKLQFSCLKTGFFLFLCTVHPMCVQ